MSDTKFTKGPLSICEVGDNTWIDDKHGFSIAQVFDCEGIIDNASLFKVAPDMYAMLESLISELNMAIDEVNTMRDINHADNLTPTDHWDKESLHNAEVLLSKARGE